MKNVVLRLLKAAFAGPTLESRHPQLQSVFSVFGKNPIETAHMHNMEDIALADFQLQREALQKSLRLTHRAIFISTLALVVSIASVVVAMKLKTDIHVTVAAPKQ